MKTKILLLDTETTGLSSPELIEVAQVFIPNQLDELKTYTLDEIHDNIYHERFKPSKPIDARASDVHGIYTRHVWNCRSHKEYKFPETDILLGHNIKFDHRVLGEPDVNLVCTLQLAKKVFPEAKKHVGSYKLVDLVKHFYGTEFSYLTNNAHGARVDVLMTYLLLIKIMEKLPKLKSIEQLVPLCSQKKTKVANLD